MFKSNDVVIKFNIISFTINFSFSITRPTSPPIRMVSKKMVRSTGEPMIGANAYIMFPCQNVKLFCCFFRNIEKLFKSLMD